MFNILFLLLVGFCSSAASFLATNPQNTDDIQYLHLLLSDEKAERMRLQTQVDKMASALQTLQEQMEEKQNCDCSKNTPNVAFRTELSKDLGSVSSNHVVIFDEVDLNLGSAYEPRHGIFTAPVNGTYLFSMALGNPKDHAGAFFMKKNSQTIEYAIAGHTTGWNMGGVTTVAELNAGDDVWVEGEGYISGAYSHIRYHTGFSGILIHAY
ncbi:complement C1q tumor necrosis factor-related protein 3-like [Mercenaria mercenaria]|uniref:complement C1q tumor necrosis factor-related protein 3-like n=1 Tax=Mercenaria mercenaria TaxID=6596 RepID=UPI00234F5123|nr:complement C1q tumor necrosis factor-related protein 3-like [Mercenaria mercenaria]